MISEAKIVEAGKMGFQIVKLSTGKYECTTECEVCHKPFTHTIQDLSELRLCCTKCIKSKIDWKGVFK